MVDIRIYSKEIYFVLSFKVKKCDIVPFECDMELMKEKGLGNTKYIIHQKYHHHCKGPSKIK
jgi:hypothetical protein